MKIAMIGPRGLPSHYGGIERHVEAVALRLAARGHGVIVYGRSHCCRRGGYGQVDVRTVPTLPTKHADTAIYSLLASMDVLRRDVDVVHYHGIGPSLFAIFPRLLGHPAVVTVHGLDWRRAKWGPVAKLALRLGEITSYAFASATVVISRTLQQHYQARHRVATEYINNGVDLPPETGLDLLGPRFGLAPQGYFLFAGRLVPEKGVHYLVKACRELRGDLKLAIAGEGAHSDDYVQSLKSLAGDDSRIRFLGAAAGEELRQLYANAFAFVLPSELEGQSLALLEAMSHGLPVVVSDIPENMEIIQDVDGRVGLAHRRGDARDLAARLKELRDSPDLARALGARARRRVEEVFSWDSAVDRLEKVYERATREGRRARSAAKEGELGGAAHLSEGSGVHR